MSFDRDMRHWLLGAMLIAAATSNAVAAPAPLPAHYAAMFDKGKTWVYDWSLVTFGAEDEKTGKPTHLTERGKVTCKVAEVTRRGGATVAHITCDQDLGRKFLVAGDWAATDKGLWRIGEASDADAIRDALKEPPTIEGQPKVGEKITHVDLFDKKHDTIVTGIRESAKIKGWCAYEDSSNADPDGGRVVTCFAQGIGIQSGYDDVGGTLNKLEYTAR